jgi:hypothetical protein
MMLALYAALTVTLAALARYVLIPWCRLEHRRRQSRGVSVAANQLWVQDNDLLWVESVDKTGIWIVTLSGGKAHRWQDSHVSWQRRIRNRVLWFSGQSRPLVEP